MSSLLEKHLSPVEGVVAYQSKVTESKKYGSVVAGEE